MDSVGIVVGGIVWGYGEDDEKKDKGNKHSKPQDKAPDTNEATGGDGDGDNEGSDIIAMDMM